MTSPKLSPRQLEIQIWSDIACPWCYVGKRRLEVALSRFEHRDSVVIHWRAFELDRTAPKVYPPSPNYVERLAHKYRFATARAQQMIDDMAARGASEGIDFKFAAVVGVNTFLAHQMSTFADKTNNVAHNELAERLFKAYFTDGKTLSDAETLVELGVQVGLPEAQLRAALDCEQFAPEAREEQSLAASMGVSGVPFFVIGRYAVEGAQPPEQLLRVLNMAWQELPEKLVLEEGDGVVCTPEGCN
jgi:predicted DsbA family dithiol-disulfide isomerase